MERARDAGAGAGAGAASEGERAGDDGSALVVGFAFMAKKMESMAEVTSMAEGPVDGVEFVPLDFSVRPNQHRHLDVILHKLSEDIMFRHARPEGDARISWIEAYLAGHPGTAIVDPVDRVANCINRVTTLELLKEAYRLHGPEGGMPRPPRFTVLHNSKKSAEDTDEFSLGPSAGRIVPGDRSELAFPVICKPVEACGTRGSHTMVVVLDEAGMVALKPPVVVQECRNHGAKLFKVCVVGDEVRVHERPSLPDLPRGLTGSFVFDSQKPYPTLAQVKAASAGMMSSHGPNQPPPPLPRPPRPSSASRTPGAIDPSPRSNQTNLPGIGVSTRVQVATAEASGGPNLVQLTVPHPVEALETTTLRGPVVTLEAARRAADRMREAFGLTIFGFDLIVDGVSGEALVIDVNYFPSFKDVRDFPQLLRRLLTEVAWRYRQGVTRPENKP
eukprot:g10870.t2